MKAQLESITVAHGPARYRRYQDGTWHALMWGWWPDGGERPSYRWMLIPTDKVPQTVQAAIAKSKEQS